MKMSRNINSFFEETAVICQLDSNTLLDRMREALRIQKLALDAGRKCMRIDPFFIENARFVIEIHTKEDFVAYVKKIKNLDVLEMTVHNYKCAAHDPSGKGIVKMLDKMIDSIREDSSLTYKMDEEPEEALAEYVCKKILDRHIKKICTALRREEGTLNQNAFLRPLIAAICRYLRNLGVYTPYAAPGQAYAEVEHWYELVQDKRKRNQNPVIGMIESLAYGIKYLDENGDVVSIGVQGLCTRK